MEKEIENLPTEEEKQYALVEYDSDESGVTVIEREKDREETVKTDRGKRIFVFEK